MYVQARTALVEVKPFFCVNKKLKDHFILVFRVRAVLTLKHLDPNIVIRLLISFLKNSTYLILDILLSALLESENFR